MTKDAVAALAEAWSKHSAISPRPWSTVEHQMEDFLSALTAAGWSLVRESEREALVAAAQAYRDLNACFRINRTPSESLFRRLAKADETMARAAMEPRP